jgi:GTPase SAR1 family protein
VAMVYDVTDRASFENIAVWTQQLRENGERNAAMVLVANKIDVKDGVVVSEEEGKRMGEQYGVPFYSCSAKVGTNVEEVFRALAASALDALEKGQLEEDGAGGAAGAGGVDLGAAPRADKRGCC